MDLIKGILRKEYADHDRFREGIMEGQAIEVPTVGHCFFLEGLALDPTKFARYMRTNVVEEVEVIRPDFYRFKTMSGSIYTFEVKP